jgi:ABC-type branched-subunit amino acid transport system substrate-binding protein
VPAVNPDQLPAAQATITRFKAAYPHPWYYGAYTMLAYDATAVLYEAMSEAIMGAGGKLPAREEVVAKLASTTAFKGETDTFGFDAAGDTTRRTVSIYEANSSDPGVGWRWITSVDYSAKLPY